MSSIQTQFLNVRARHSQYLAIDPKTTLKGSASGKIIFISGASQGIGQATAVAFAQAGAKAIYITATSEKALGETKAQVSTANPDTQCEYMVCDVTDEEHVKASICWLTFAALARQASWLSCWRSFVFCCCARRQHDWPAGG
jgi:hypothetical protein